MQPTTPRHFLKVAIARLNAAEEIMGKLGLALEAQYIGGYSIECSLKSLILQTSSVNQRAVVLRQITHGANSHRVETLLALLKHRNIVLNVDLIKRLHRFEWTTDLRYEIGPKDADETNGLLRTARFIYEWTEPQIT